MAAASTPITETELANMFAASAPAVVESDAQQFIALVNGNWDSAAVRRRYFTLMTEAGATKHLDHANGVHVFTFADGSTLNVGRNGVTL